MPANQLPLPIARPHNNQQLFSDYYLDSLLPKRPQWALLTDEAERVRRSIAAIFAAYTPSSNEAQTERDLVRPILETLGHDFEVQPALKTPDGTKKPDYVFYRDKGTLSANKNRTLDDALPRQGGFAVGDAKHWDRSLDTTLRQKTGDPFTNKNPSFQIAFYIQHSGVDWGVLTNGRLWRLYHRETAHKLDRFYEGDLSALLEGDAEAFLYFYVFFRRSAFEEQPLGVAEILRESVEFAHSVGDSLKSQVYDSLLHLAQGFLDYPGNRLTADPAALHALHAVYDNALIVLYRLLFVLYAEDRDLLPVREPGMYRDTYSLYAIKRAVARDLTTGRHLLPTSARLWPQLRDLFGIIDRGSPPLQVGTFNGGLFDPEKHAFLERYTIGDAHLQRALDKLARVGGEFVDYRDLSVRHLGTIYEGLLEHHLEVVPPEQAADGPESRSDEPIRLRLINDKGERKATGSYYTPDFIVKYIVEQTVGPILREAAANASGDAACIEAVLNVNVLDPAMGSGHFLIEATEFIARFLVDLDVTPEGIGAGEADLAYWKRRVAQSCIYGVDLNPLAVELAKLSLWLTTIAKDRPLSFLDHHLRTGNALVGARLDDLQFGQQAERKRKRVSQAAKQEAAGQVSMLSDDAFRQSMSLAVGNMWLIEGSESRTVEQVKQQESLYADLRAAFTGKYGRLADAVTATHFGLSLDPALWRPLSDFATGRAITTLPEIAGWLESAERIAAEKRFFHWELEFPEVFFDRHGRPLGSDSGFDAVIGNPPYVRQEDLVPFKSYFAEKFPTVYHGVADLFVYFFGQALRLLCEGGRTSYISSNSWLRANYAGPLRKLLRTSTTVEALIDLGDNRVFADAPDVYPAIHVVRLEPPPAEHTAQVAVFTRGEGLSQFAEQTAEKLFPVSMHDQEDTGWQLGNDVGRRIFRKIMAVGKSLGEVINGQMFRGVLTGCNDAFIIDKQTRNMLVQSDASVATLIKPLINGEDVRPWHIEDEGRWLIFARRGIRIEDYPLLQKYLQQFRNKLEPCPIDWDTTSIWPGRKQGNYRWYEIQDSVEYHRFFEQTNIFWPEMAKQPRFTFGRPGVVCNKTAFFIAQSDPYLLGVLMTRCIWFAISRLCIPIGERKGMLRYTLSAQFISRLPIPDAPAAERETIGRLAMAITEQARARYELHRRAQHRLLADFGVPGNALNQKLTAWWDLNFTQLRAELQKVFRRDIPLKERDDWEAWLDARQAEHRQRTAEIIRLETELNARVYALFALTPDEIQVIEESTKYRYGEV